MADEVFEEDFLDQIVAVNWPNPAIEYEQNARSSTFALQDTDKLLLSTWVNYSAAGLALAERICRAPLMLSAGGIRIGLRPRTDRRSREPRHRSAEGKPSADRDGVPGA